MTTRSGSSPPAVVSQPQPLRCRPVAKNPPYYPRAGGLLMEQHPGKDTCSLKPCRDRHHDRLPGKWYHHRLYAYLLHSHSLRLLLQARGCITAGLGAIYLALVVPYPATPGSSLRLSSGWRSSSPLRDRAALAARLRSGAAGLEEEERLQELNRDHRRNMVRAIYEQSPIAIGCMMQRVNSPCQPRP